MFQILKQFKNHAESLKEMGRGGKGGGGQNSFPWINKSLQKSAQIALDKYLFWIQKRFSSNYFTTPFFYK